MFIFVYKLYYMKPKKNKLISLRVDEETYNYIDLIAKKLDRSISWVVDSIIKKNKN